MEIGDWDFLVGKKVTYAAFEIESRRRRNSASDSDGESRASSSDWKSLDGDKDAPPYYLRRLIFTCLELQLCLTKKSCLFCLRLKNLV